MSGDTGDAETLTKAERGRLASAVDDVAYLHGADLTITERDRRRVVATVESILSARLAAERERGAAEAWDKGFAEGVIAQAGLVALDNPYRVVLPPESEGQR